MALQHAIRKRSATMKFRFARAVRAGLLAMLATNAAMAADEPAAAESFDIGEFRVLGNSVLKPIDIERAVYPHLGPGRTIADVEAARAALELAYRNHGYNTVFIDIPEQDVDEGVVRLKVTEGRIERLRVTGARYFSGRKIRAGLQSVQPGTVPQFPELQRELQSLSREARDRELTPVLRSGRTPGTVELEIKVRDQLPLHGGIEVNDRYTADTSRTRVGANLSYDNLWNRGDSISFQYQTAPEAMQEVDVFAGTYVTRLGSSGNLLALYVVDSASDVATIGTLSVLGGGQVYGARLIVPISATAASSQSFTLGADFKDFNEKIRLLDQTPETPIRYSTLSAQYSTGWNGERRQSSFGLGATVGLRGPSDDDEEFNFKRFNSRPNFFYLRGSFTHLERLPFGLAAAMKLAGQYTDQALVSNEQFSIGGVETVRGYLESELLGELGLAGSIELRSPTLLRRSAGGGGLQLLAFWDAGIVRVLDPLGQAARSDLASVGAGLRLSGWGLDAALDWAYPLVPGNRTVDGDSRLHFSIHYGF
jgi:hemolysin activation/secretion protein